MEKNTVLFIVFTTIILGFMMFQTSRLAPPAPQAVERQEEAAEWRNPSAALPLEPAVPVAGIHQAVGENTAQEYVTIETDILRVVLSNSGGDIVSFQLKGHLDNGEPVEMLFAGDAKSQGFSVVLGNLDDAFAGRNHAGERNFRVNRIGDSIVEFSQEFYTPEGNYFTFTKRYVFTPGEYMFELTISFDGGVSARAFNFRGAAYTLVFGPQIGPRFTKQDLSQRFESRDYFTFSRGNRRGKIRSERVNERGEPTVITSQPSWAAIAGKYFTLVAIPIFNQFDLAFANHPEPGLPGSSRLLITRPAVNNFRIEDTYRFFLGPKNADVLIRYERGDNHFRLSETGMAELANTRGFWAFFSPLERVLKWFLIRFYAIVPNYGVAIIFLTLLVKLALFPLTKKGSEGILRMQALAPKMKEMQEKYKDNRQKLNQEMAEFYRKEKYNPLSGCLPMLLQMPIFISMFNLFNNHFDLRGAEFIPGWIPDLSRPEYIFSFPEGFQLPLLGWTALRLLPFIYVGSQLLYGKVTQTPEQRGNKQMQIMLYAMPVIFFFVLYNMPSGLLLYWIMSNILTMVQQILINKYVMKKRAIAAAAEPPPVIVPGPKKRRKK